MKRKPSDVLLILAICTVILSAPAFADAAPTRAPFSQYGNSAYSSDMDGLQQANLALPKIGRIVENNNLIWGENAGWVNLRTAHTALKIGSNILAGWIWLENCGWVCLGGGRPLERERYSNRSVYDWGINNDGQGKLAGYAWSEVTGWISFHTSHSRVYLDESGQFYGYAWGENVGWMHFGPGRTVTYLAKADPGPWQEIGRDEGRRLAGSPDDSEMSSGSVPVTGLNITHERYNKDARTVCLIKLGRDDFCMHIRCSDTPIYISSLAKLSPIRAPPMIG
ncbi:MAG: hypothetical protein NTZ78_09275 [Candidatus Aureabacteria bacterium]|nr:hypothetical protein [Candidatus Auribacterota bacterium]